jgi:hypothetical protein
MLVSTGIVSVAVDPTTQKVLLILAALLVGGSVGLVGALLFGLVAGGRARRQPAPAARMPAPAVTYAAPQPIAGGPAPAPGAFVAPDIGSAPARLRLDADMVRDRHRELYDSEYAKQVHHVDALRRTIGTRLAVGGELHRSSEESDA